MGGRPQKREKASGRKEWELGSTWNLKWTHVGIGVRCLRWDVGTLSSFYVVLVLRWDVGTGLRWYRFTIEAVYD